MDEMTEHGKIGRAAMRAAMHRNTARKYLRRGKLPSEMRTTRGWRTRDDPIAKEDWEEIVARLRDASGFETKVLFEDLISRKPDRYHAGQLRTFQRRVRQWRAAEGPPKEIFFPQEHRPGEAMQTDFTCANELGITIGGEAFPHLFGHSVLPYSNWQSVIVCHSESMSAIKRAVQKALFGLGRVPEFHQTDHSTAATHDLKTGGRGFNVEYFEVMEHFGMKPRTIQVGEKHQNGDVESSNGAFKRRVEQHLLLRGSRDFETRGAYEAWIDAIAEKTNRLRWDRVEKELAVMRPLPLHRLPEYREIDVRVSRWSLIRVRESGYSVPSRLMGERVVVRVFEDRIEVFYRGVHQLTTARAAGHHRARIDYRHLIHSLIRKPGAFARYRYREDLFPTLVFRRAYDSLREALTESQADLEYLRLLHAAASTSESAVEAAIGELLDRGEVPRSQTVKASVSPERPEIPELAVPAVDLAQYDELLAVGEEVRS
jgi:hypothetical protein